MRTSILTPNQAARLYRVRCHACQREFDCSKSDVVTCSKCLEEGHALKTVAPICPGCQRDVIALMEHIGHLATLRGVVERSVTFTGKCDCPYCTEPQGMDWSCTADREWFAGVCNRGCGKRVVEQF